ncbi:DUF5694 domain-containing protein [Maribacter aestuarii]|uniref:DUF5694 domain-containing protein n=1 Tax=Maribacter aestuarii TaxID=1130723 RepID=UPI00248AA31A|nr:DUF5694 domain-containing protein [Maribacter aestuarii]
MKRLLSLFTLLIFVSCQQNEKSQIIESPNKEISEAIEVLIIGTFHFENFNPENNGDVIEVNLPDVLTIENQLELEKIAKAIVNFNPNKIFLEYPFAAQEKVDSIYKNFTSTDFSKVKRDERYQLGFRVAKMIDHEKVYAMDFRTHFPFDSLMTQMEKAKQYDLIAKDSLEVLKIEDFENELYSSNKNLSEMLFYQNDNKKRKEDINWYLSLANKGGEKGNFVGAYLTSEWYRRNLYMYSIIQKEVEQEDNKIMILAGASHIAMFKDFMDYNPEWKTIELKDIMKE